MYAQGFGVTHYQNNDYNYEIGGPTSHWTASTIKALRDNSK